MIRALFSVGQHGKGQERHLPEPKALERGKGQAQQAITDAGSGAFGQRRGLFHCVRLMQACGRAVHQVPGGRRNRFNNARIDVMVELNILYAVQHKIQTAPEGKGAVCRQERNQQGLAAVYVDQIEHPFLPLREHVCGQQQKGAERHVPEARRRRCLLRRAEACGKKPDQAERFAVCGPGCLFNARGRGVGIRGQGKGAFIVCRAVPAGEKRFLSGKAPGPRSQMAQGACSFGHGTEDKSTRHSGQTLLC